MGGVLVINWTLHGVVGIEKKKKKAKIRRKFSEASLLNGEQKFENAEPANCNRGKEESLKGSVEV